MHYNFYYNRSMKKREIKDKTRHLISSSKLITVLSENQMNDESMRLYKKYTKSFPTINEDLKNYYIELLSKDAVYCVNADIHYMITVKDEYKSCTDEDERREKFNSLPREFRSEYHLKRDRVDFFNSSTMIADMMHLTRKNKA